MQVPKEMCEKEYYSRFIQGLWVIPGVAEKKLGEAAIGARQARFEFGETPMLVKRRD